MIFLVIFGVCVAVAIVCGILYHHLSWTGQDICLGMILISIVCAILFGFISLMCYTDEKQFYAEYEEIITYYEGYEFTNELEQSLINQKKHDVNTKLSENKASAKTRPLCWFNPDKVLELDYIY